MSKYQDFVNKVKEDAELQAKIKEVKDAAAAKIVEIAKEEGFDLKAEDLGKGELSEDELEQVAAAGGGSRGSCGTGYTPLY